MVRLRAHPILLYLASLLVLTGCLEDLSSHSLGPTDAGADADAGPADSGDDVGDAGDDAADGSSGGFDADASDMPDVCVGETDEELCDANGLECHGAELTDRCGDRRTVDCGNCLGFDACIGNLCACNAETNAAFCDRLGSECGMTTAADNCGDQRSVDCGGCMEPDTCGAVDPNLCGCVAETDDAFCDRLVKNCDMVTDEDNCGDPRTVDCGDCTMPATCSGGGTPNVCGCSAQSDSMFCSANDAECGTLTATDACNQTRTVDCGVCPEFETCGGAGTPNECGCTPESDADLCTRLGKDCGSITELDNCGTERTADCGTCTSPETCGGGGTANVCGCTSETDSEFCSRLGAQCGGLTASDNCGVQRTVDCGTCTNQDTCNNNQCNCTPQSDTDFCAANNAECGELTANDNCGTLRTANCGTCNTTTEACENNTCVPIEICDQAGDEDGDGASDCADSDCEFEPCDPTEPTAICDPNGVCCVPDDDATFCSNNGADCGVLNATDNCGVTRTADCGSCTSPLRCRSKVCTCSKQECSTDAACEGERCDHSDPSLTCQNGSCE